jgi:LysW-gamma-L-lysine carboxypeptidase
MSKSVAFLEELVSIPSPSGHEAAVSEFLVGSMAGLGFDAYQDEVGNAIGVLGRTAAARSIVLLGHMDTVPGHIPVRTEEGRLYGRGTVDAKGSLATFVMAAARVAERLGDTRMAVIGAVEEEAHGRGARHLARTVPPPDCAIIGEPSDWECVTLGYKGMLSVDYRLTQPGAHGAAAQAGPAEKAISFWNRLMSFAAEYNQGEWDRFSTLDPALRDFNTFSDGLYDGANLNIVMRIPPGLRVAELQEQVQGWCNGAQVKFHPSDPPFQAEKNTPLVRGMLRGIRAHGGRPRFKLKTGTADMNIVGPAWGCPIVAYGPGDSSLDHTPEEHIVIAEYERAINVLAEALLALVD